MKVENHVDSVSVKSCNMPKFKMLWNPVKPQGTRELLSQSQCKCLTIGVPQTA